MQTGRSALVTGATGFVGAHLVKRLARSGWNVHIVVRKTSELEIIRDVLGSITIHVHEGTTEQLCEIAASARPDVVFHLASCFIAQHNTDDVETLVRSNVLFGAQLLESMAVNGIERLVNTGTSWQHFESGEYNPVNLYAATKQAFEAILLYYLEITPLKAITLKLFDTYGPDDPRPKLMTLLQKLAEQEVPLQMSPGEQLIDLVHIDDVVGAFEKAAARLFSETVHGHEVYGVSSGKPVRLKDLVALYGQVAGRKLPIEWGGRPYRPREVMVPWNSWKALPEWHPQIGLEEGLLRLKQR